jgi:glycosyltransferase involved in cell wall biosynthesis
LATFYEGFFVKKTTSRIRLACLTSHPVQYQVPLFRLLAKRDDVSFKAFFCSDISVKSYHDKGFACAVKWDTPLLEGYDYEFLPRLGSNRLSALSPVNYGLLAQLKRDRINVLWLHGYARPYYLWIIFVARLMGIKVLVRSETASRFSEKGFLKRLIRPLFFKGLNRLVNGFLTIGRLNKAFWRAQGIPEKKIFLAPYSVDNQYFQQAAKAASAQRQALKEKWGLALDRPVILFASKFLKRKHAGDLLAAYSQLVDSHREIKKPYLLFVGDGEMRRSLEKQVAQNNLSDDVLFLGFQNQSQLPAFFDLCDVFVLPSTRENWGLIVNEVMNASRPVIVSDEIGCAPDLVKESENGVVYQARDIAALCEALVFVLSSPEKQQQMGRKSLEIINRWGIEETVSGIMAACLSVSPEIKTKR